jgi:glycosyltransferase, group 2 family
MSISVVILTFNEVLHIERCIGSVRRVSDKIYVVDSHSTDGTQEIAQRLGATVVEHDYVNQAQQMQWAINNLGLDTEWVMRMDADEYLTDKLVDEVKTRLPKLPKNVTGVYLTLDVIFQGKNVKHGRLHAPKIMRIWRRGKAYMEQRWMDERMVLTEGSAITFKGRFVDHNLNSLAWWTQKHNNYSNRELAVEAMRMYGIGRDDEALKGRNQKKGMYYRLPAFFRAGVYFSVRYFLLGGFIDGKAGLIWATLQAYWYRFLIDAKMSEMKRALGKNPSQEQVKSYFKEKYNIELA